MDEPKDEPISALPSPGANTDVSPRDAELERQIKLGLEILERYRETFEALAK
jgi:hypothetical protein